MGDLRQVRQRFILVATILAAVNLGLLLYLFWPGPTQPSQQVLQERYTSLKREVSLLHASNPEKTREDLKQLYAANLPNRDSQISQRVDKLVHEAGVTADSIRYPSESAEKATLPDVQEIKIDTNVTGDYSKVARFINSLEQDKLLFIIDKISLTGQQGGTVSLQITFSTFLRQTA